jgi:hypothetical protein
VGSKTSISKISLNMQDFQNYWGFGHCPSSSILETRKNNVGFEVFTSVAMTNAVFWDVVQCRSCANRRFAGTYRLQLQGRQIRERETSVFRLLAGWSVYPEVWSDTFLRNVCSNKIYTTPHPKRQLSRKHNVSKRGSVSVLRWGGKTPNQLGRLERANLNHWTTC